MAIRTDTFDLGALRLTSGEGRHLDLDLLIEPLELGGHTYRVSAVGDQERPDAPAGQLPAQLDISRTTGSGYVLRLRFDAALHGPCMRCLEPADPSFHVDSREVSQPGEEDEEFVSPYVLESMLDVNAWARDALVLVVPPTLLHAPDCLGLCPVCGADLNTAGPDHHHESGPDPRWAVLSELHFEGQEAPVGDDASGQAAPGPDAASEPPAA
jgi:uncharacterized protein